MLNPIKFKLYQDKTKDWRWQIVSTGNGKIIADSGEGYRNRADCLRMIEVIKKSAATALLEDAQAAIARALMANRTAVKTLLG